MRTWFSVSFQTRISLKMDFLSVCLTFLLLILTKTGVESHGRLMNPPARNSMWRAGYPNPPNYEDNELFCGGLNVQWSQNEGKCGVCGDAWNDSPREHEYGGKYANGIITRTFSPGQVIEAEIELTSNHYGEFAFHLCPLESDSHEATEECFNLNELDVTGLNGTSKIYKVPKTSPPKAMFKVKVQLPSVACDRCVFQWRYRTANTWGENEEGQICTGCGPQETFINCADISILTNSHTGDAQPEVLDNPFLIYDEFSNKPIVIRSQACYGTPGIFSTVQGMNDWCEENCLVYPPNCPKSHCKCYDNCEPLPHFSIVNPNAHYFCLEKCLVRSEKCPWDKCHCF